MARVSDGAKEESFGSTIGRTRWILNLLSASGQAEERQKRGSDMNMNKREIKNLHDMEDTMMTNGKKKKTKMRVLVKVENKMKMAKTVNMNLKMNMNMNGKANLNEYEFGQKSHHEREDDCECEAEYDAVNWTELPSIVWLDWRPNQSRKGGRGLPFDEAPEDLQGKNVKFVP
jgi:hypothetical protein